MPAHLFAFFFFFNDTATTEIYTLSLHDALPILARLHGKFASLLPPRGAVWLASLDLDGKPAAAWYGRSEEHTSELQSQSNLVCRLLLEKKKSDHHTSTSAYHIAAHPRTSSYSIS